MIIKPKRNRRLTKKQRILLREIYSWGSLVAWAVLLGFSLALWVVTFIVLPRRIAKNELLIGLRRVEMSKRTKVPTLEDYPLRYTKDGQILVDLSK